MTFRDWSGTRFVPDWSRSTDNAIRLAKDGCELRALQALSVAQALADSTAAIVGAAILYFTRRHARNRRKVFPYPILT
jgi:hypothetical protein